MTEVQPDMNFGHALIVIPHSDDEILLYAGLIQRLLAIGQVPDVALVTNGDYEATTSAEGVVRPRETLRALAMLGMPEQHIYLLGYADTGMPREDSFLWGLYRETDENAVHTSHVGTQTYGPAEHPELHRVIFGKAGSYTRKTFLLDLQALLEKASPDRIFTTHPRDAHGDHCALYYLLRQVSGTIPVYTAFTHSHGGDAVWPDGGKLLTCPPDIRKEEWQNRWVLHLTPEEQNRKAQTLEVHKTAMKPDAVVFLRRFCKADEVYFPSMEEAK